ncbi:MAG TPA: hypothetical protein VJS88_06120, partial [Chthoniobacterales bacterium]|nr:hypothetical protein [Chthoniobacterales bacterium]
MSQLGDFADEALATSIEIAGDTFSWNGRNYAGVIDQVNRILTTSKSYFEGRVYPKCGDAIRIVRTSGPGKKYQIVRKGNSRIEASRGGFIESPPFVDDPGDPALELEFDHFVR